MDTETLLMGFAEMAIALAGFTTIATIIVKVSDATSENLLAVRLKTVLIFSIHLIVISISPFLLYQLDPNPEQYWRSSALVSFVSGGVVAYISFVQLLPRVLKDSKNSWWQTISSVMCGSASVVTGIFTIFGNNASFWYSVTLSLVLGTCLIMLAGLVLSFPVFDIHRKKI
jgi:uncharacterized membrane protein YgdD (TMEM256/DUF423 family)